MCWKLFWATLIAKGRYVVYKIYTFTQIHHIMAVHSNTPIWHCKFFPLNNLSVIPDLQSLHCLIISQSEIGFPGWRHRPTQPILLVTWRWTTVGRILWILKIHRKSRKNHTTITFSPMWSEQKGPFWRLRKNLGARGTLRFSKECPKSKIVLSLLWQGCSQEVSFLRSRTRKWTKLSWLQNITSMCILVSFGVLLSVF